MSATKQKAEPFSRDRVLPQSPQGNSKSYRPRSAQEHLYKTKHSPWTGSACFFKDILRSGRGVQEVEAQVALHLPWAEKTSIPKPASIHLFLKCMFRD